jgi:phosphohistidine phosphatase
MRAIFIRHASAEAPGDGPDEARKLTRAGKGEAKAAGLALKAIGVKLDRILTSPLVRSVETAELVAAVQGKVKIEKVGFLGPPGDLRALRRRLVELQRDKVDYVALVGHTPIMEGFLGHILIGRADVGISLPKAGAACLELGENWPRGEVELRWLLRRDQLELLSRLEA